MDTELKEQLIKGLTEAHAIEQQAIRLLEVAPRLAGDDEVARIYGAHLIQTKEHERYISERLEAYGETPSRLKDAAAQAGALGLGALVGALPDTPIRLATTAFAFEHLEIAAYRLLHRLAESAQDAETVAVVDRILEQEEAAAELIEGTFDRVLETTLGEPPESQLTPVSPIGKPSERTEPPGTQHPGPQGARERTADEPIDQPEHVDTPVGGEHLEEPQPGHPVGETEPYGTERR